MSDQIEYKDGFKYQLQKTYTYKSVILGYNISTDYCKLEENGLLTIYMGYCWDGPSGPTVDTPNFMRGSLIHDVFYQILRDGLLPQSERFIADKILQLVCREDGMSRVRAWYVFVGVDKGGASSASPHNKKETLTAP